MFAFDGGITLYWVAELIVFIIKTLASLSAGVRWLSCCVEMPSLVALAGYLKCNGSVYSDFWKAKADTGKT